MLKWRLLRSDSRSTVELWQTPTEYLVCQKYLSLFYFYENFKETMDHYLKIVQKEYMKRDLGQRA